MHLKDIVSYLSIEDFKNNLIPVLSPPVDDKRTEFYKLQARQVDADYIYCFQSELENHFVPYIYIYDERKSINSRDVKQINKQIWTKGEIALAIFVYTDEIKIIDTRKPISTDNKLNIIFDKINKIDECVRHRIFEGKILEEEEYDYIKVSPYQILLDHIENNITKNQDRIGCDEKLLKKLIIKFILIKYLEEQKDENGLGVFASDYFNQFLNSNKKYSSPKNFCDVLRKGDIVKLFENLDSKFNGSIFKISNQNEILSIRNANFGIVADALDGNKQVNNQMTIWRLYDFKLLPIEFISRLYERFVISSDNARNESGSYYTPPHLAKLLIDELLPFDKIVDFKNFRLLDPACGSGIFLVLAYKRLITLWMISKNKNKIDGKEDIEEIKQLLSDCIFGLDINPEALSITATSLQIELTSHISPKEIWNSLRFNDLLKQKNLVEADYFSWYKTEKQKYNVIVGNPPFKIAHPNNICKTKIGYYESHDNKLHPFPENNPALAFLYFSLRNILADKGTLFMVLPATTILYNTNSSAKEFRDTIIHNWSIRKIYDFTPLRNYLWSGAAVATIALLVDSKENNSLQIQHIIIRNTVLNKGGSLRFEIDKYDRFNIPIDISIEKPHIWKSNLLGGSYTEMLIDYYNSKTTVEDYVKLNGWILQDGAKSSESEGISISQKGKPLLISRKVKSDIITGNELQYPTKKYRLDNLSIYNSPNILIKCNLNQNIPIILNKDKEFYFDNSFLGIGNIKNEDIPKAENFVNSFKSNRKLYKFLITIKSSKPLLQKAGVSLFNSRDIKNLPLIFGKHGEILPFPNETEIETAIIEDTKLLADSMSRKTEILSGKISTENLDVFCTAFSSVLNEIYTSGNYKFRLTRKIIGKAYVYVTFRYSNKKNLVSSTKGTDLDHILVDDISNAGLRINRIITYFGRDDEISLIKPNKLKYWTRLIAFRDAENVKAEMFKNGY